MAWIIGITTAPRHPATLDRTTESLTNAGFNRLHIVEDKEGIAGAYRTWRRTLTQLVSMGNATHILLCQDDIVMCRGVKEYLERDLWPSPKTGVVSLYCSAKWSKLPSDIENMVRIPADNIWGCCALAFPHEAADALLRTRRCRQWRRREKIDWFVGSTMRQLGLEVYAYRPSLVQHIGNRSSIKGHGRAVGERRSNTFLGEDADVSIRKGREQRWALGKVA